MDEIIDNKTTQTMQDVTKEEEKTVNKEEEDDEFKSIYDTTDLVIRRKKILKKKIKHKLKSENSDNTNILDDFTIVHQEEIDKV